jgi:hypothetical protein
MHKTVVEVKQHMSMLQKVTEGVKIRARND